MTDIDQRNQAPEDENKLIAQRREKLHQIRQMREAFPNDFDRTDQSEQIHRAHGYKNVQELQEEARRVSVAGRIIRARGPFVVIQDGYGQLQLYMNNKTFDEVQAAELKALDLGDIVGANGELFKTQRGELTVRVSEFRLLTKALRPLPDKHRGLSDTETRYRQRYVDLIANDASRQIFAIRSKIVRYIRDYFHNRGFMEVETPMMQVIPGGATARPFTTHHNALDQDMYLRIAPELFLKRLTVGGYEKVFELNRNFRNEGLSTRHNPEFTMLEFYWAYARYDDLMDLTEDLFRSIANEVLGSSSVKYQDMEFDFAKPFARLTVKEAVRIYCQLDDSVDLDDVKSLTREARRLGVSFDENWPKGKVLMEIFEQRVEESLEQPTFITEYPIDVSPLARRNESNPEVTDRFELIVGGRELANGFSELNDPEDQAARFHAQVAQKDAGDQEAMHFDEDYITALEYGMPPTAGEGIGIDRLIMLFTNSASIKDVLLFPHMRPRRDEH